MLDGFIQIQMDTNMDLNWFNIGWIQTNSNFDGFRSDRFQKIQIWMDGSFTFTAVYNNGQSHCKHFHITGMDACTSKRLNVNFFPNNLFVYL